MNKDQENVYLEDMWQAFQEADENEREAILAELIANGFRLIAKDLEAQQEEEALNFLPDANLKDDE